MLALARFVLLLAAWMTAAPGRAADDFTFGYLGRDGDPAYTAARSYTGVILLERHPAIDGVRTALRESAVIGRSAGVRFVLAEELAGEGEAAGEAARRLLQRGAQALILDLPGDDLRAVAAALEDAPVLLFNPRHGDDELRGRDCQWNLFHTLPSDAMRMDGLAQYLRGRDWLDVLMLVGPDAEDARLGAAFAASARKFGLRIVDRRAFVLTKDPRQREQNNIRILTQGSYDVVFVADHSREVGRYVPYATMHPRPVVGSEGLMADAWHWSLERYGAPQLSQRFQKLSGRRMDSHDFAAWAAVRSVVEAIVRSRELEARKLGEVLVSGMVPFDAYKSLGSSYRPWDRQLRQSIVLHTDNAVIAMAPIEGFLHQRNTLDSLGTDQPESSCRLN